MTTKTAAEQVAEALENILGIVADSRGISGYHLNGALAEWNEFEEIDAAHAALERWRAEQDSAPKTASQGGEA